ncbi:sterol desaturase family protein [Mucilaginibacter sp.]|uniref:sterol desaturase family protein n=1 Tax=Mucilaginibacter sp. TaxID=1882438 RepID=UPI002845CA57|nr:sterol desaturase family protein [Mucilaginibacter sp.]MDR3695587.1 sterol desaturase family protein [Mucilaginibacter sp.]
MSFTKNPNKNWRIIENVAFVCAFGFIMYNLISTYWRYAYASIKGHGYIGAIIDPLRTHEYYKSFISVMIILNATCILWEILRLIIQLLKQERGNTHDYHKFKRIFKQVSINYKPSFLALLILELLPKLFFIHMFWIWLPHIQKIGLFTINLKWYSWVYAYLCWEFSTWIFHFSSHRVRFLWCLHAPHHAPTELNMTVNWVHFFAESYYSTIVHLLILTPLGVKPVMFVAIMSISSVWGVFTHVSERTLKKGKLGLLQYLLITPAHHRVHHAKNPLYVDTNFATVVPVWDWMFGTLQPYKEEVSADYGLTRDLDVTNFWDLYFGEIIWLYRDVKKAGSIKDKLLYIVMPPGWTPVCSSNTASAMRRDFLKSNPALGITSKNRLMAAIKSLS